MRILRYACVCVALLLVAGCDTIKNIPQPLSKTATLDLYVVSSTKTPSSKQVTDPDTNAVIFLATPAIITAADVATIQRSDDSPNSMSLSVNLTPAGATKLASATANPTGMQLAIVVNGVVIATPTVRSPISTGFCISGGELTKNGEQLFDALTKD